MPLILFFFFVRFKDPRTSEELNRSSGELIPELEQMFLPKEKSLKLVRLKVATKRA